MILKMIRISIIQRMRRKKETQNVIKLIRMTLQEMRGGGITEEMVIKEIKVEMRMKRKAINEIVKEILIKKNLETRNGTSKGIWIEKLCRQETRRREITKKKLTVKKVLARKINMIEGTLKAMVIKKITKMKKGIKIAKRRKAKTLIEKRKRVLLMTTENRMRKKDDRTVRERSPVRK